MKNMKYTEAQLVDMKLHLIEGLLKAQKESYEITKALNEAVDHKKILTEKYNFSTVQADCILDLKISISDLDEQLCLSTFKDLIKQRQEE